MYEEKKLAPSLLDHFSVGNHPVHSKNSIAFQNNEIVLNVLECSRHNLYILFLTFLMATEQQELLLPVFESVPHSKLIENFESYLLDSIDAESDLLFELYRSHVINSAQRANNRVEKNTEETKQRTVEYHFKNDAKVFQSFPHCSSSNWSVLTL